MSLSDEELALLQRDRRALQQESHRPDPVELPPDGPVTITPKVSREIARRAEDESLAAIAEDYNVSVMTVVRHRDACDITPRTVIDKPKCIVMREMATDGMSSSEIAKRLQVSQEAVLRHASTARSCQHTHQVPRVDMNFTVDSAECDRMRWYAHNDYSGPEIAEIFGRTRDTVNKHVSAARDCSCENEVEPVCYD